MDPFRFLEESNQRFSNSFSEFDPRDEFESMENFFREIERDFGFAFPGGMMGFRGPSSHFDRHEDPFLRRPRDPFEKIQTHQ